MCLVQTPEVLHENLPGLQ